jgi:hypothetical protein
VLIGGPFLRTRPIQPELDFYHPDLDAHAVRKLFSLSLPSASKPATVIVHARTRCTSRIHS